jgi:ABC-type Fe3+-hydroxamate transport system substrate-binding protein
MGQLVLTACLAIQIGSCADEQTDSAGQMTQPSADRQPVRSIRLVSLSPLATRFVVEIGARRHLVGVDLESRTLLGLDDLPAVNLSNLDDLRPTLVLVAEIPVNDSAARDLKKHGARMIEFAPHDMEEVFELCRGLGAELVGIASANSYERRISRPVAIVAGQSPPTGRPRVVAVVGFDPLMLAGGHSFETDLIENAGGSSITHGLEDTTLEITSARLRALAPDLVLVTSDRPATASDMASARSVIPDGLQIAFFDFDREAYWLREPVKDTERLRSLFLSLGLEKPVE